ncbi:MAG: hypothetical protein JKX74_05955, partial [Flavobacteriales bacterium]|nr:hypothetical protein [Flavobacteriales bacterium]
IRSNKISLTTFGQKEVENKNALNIYSAALLGYNQTKVVAASQNSEYIEMFNDNMEDYGYFMDNGECKPIVRSYLLDFEISDCLNSGGIAPNVTFDWGPIDLGTPDTPLIDTPALPPVCRSKHLADDGHTGLSSYIVHCNNGPVFRFPIVHQDSCADHFALHPQREYILSMWLKDPTAGPGTLSYDFKVTLNFGNNAASMAVTSGHIIDGWQKLEAKFKVPPNRNRLELDFNSLSADSVLLDDIRIHPFNATMATSVYNPSTLLLMAQLDENNYATFYEYDQEHQLTRINQETKKGILTSKEFYYNLQKKPPRPPKTSSLDGN